MASIEIGTFYGYANGNDYGKYTCYFQYDSITRSGSSVTVNNARLYMYHNDTGYQYTTNRIAYRAGIGGSQTNIANNITINSYNTHSAGSYNLPLGSPSTTATTTSFNFYIAVASTGASSGWDNFQTTVLEWNGTLTAPPYVVWNDINAYQPESTTQNGLIFDLVTSDGGSWSGITNEPVTADFTKAIGTTATVSNIRSNVIGAHYWKNSITNSAASSFSWTFNTENYIVEIFSAWDTYTVAYNANGGNGVPGNQTKTYGKSLTLSSTIPTRTNHEFLGWSRSSSATSATWSAGGTFTENATNDGDTITLYAVWKPLYYDFDLKILTPEGVESKNATTLGSVQMSVDNGNYQTVVDEPQSQYLYTSTFKFKNINLAPGLRLSSVTGATWDSTNQVYTATQPAEALTITFQTAYKGSKVKNNDTWKSGNVYIKVNGNWVAAKTVYIKQNNSWKEIPYKDINS